MTSEVLLGLFDGYMSIKCDALTSMTKIGGQPTYAPALQASIDLEGKVQQWTRCGVCGHPMSLLLQAFSPLPESPSASPHHRMLYLFACNSSYCARQPSRSSVCFSAQIDVDDEDALADAEDENDEDEVIETGPLLPSELPPNTLPPCFVHIDAEPEKEIIEPTDIEQELIRMSEANAKSTMTEEDMRQLESVVDLKDKSTDYYYERFRARVARTPTQVLRYYSRPCPASSAAKTEVPQRKAIAPIFMNPKKVQETVTIPACPRCGSAMAAELQLMPTVLYYLRVGEYTRLARKGPPAASASAEAAASDAASRNDSLNADDGIDFATMTVYACSRHCTAQMPGAIIQKEFLCVEEPPNMRDERRAEREQQLKEGQVPRHTLWELIHGSEAASQASSGDEDDE